LIQAPTSIVSLLAEAIPNTGVFFTCFVMLKGSCQFVSLWFVFMYTFLHLGLVSLSTASSLFIMLLQIGRLIVTPIMKKFVCVTPRDFRKVEGKHHQSTFAIFRDPV
jgi:hypothetical protein